MRENCYLYIHKNNSGCEIPCKLENCVKELHHFIDCPIWTCKDFNPTTTTAQTTTTTTTKTTPPISTTTPDTPSPFIPLIPLPIDQPVVIYSSLVLNILLILLLIIIFYYKCKKCITRRIRNFRNRNARPFVDNLEGDQNVETELTNARQIPSNRNRFFSLVSDSTDDGENEPLLQNVELSSESPRVPSFLNSPTIPSPTTTSATNSLENPNYFFMFRKKTDPLGNLPANSLNLTTFQSQTLRAPPSASKTKKKAPAVPPRTSSQNSKETTV